MVDLRHGSFLSVGLAFAFILLQYQLSSQAVRNWRTPIQIKTKNIARSHPRVLYLKTHKTGSSAITNLLIRYGVRESMTFALPPTAEGIYFGRPFLFSDLEPIPWHNQYLKNQKYDVFAMHTIWNYTAMRTLMGDNCLYFTSLRKPLDQFESRFHEYGFGFTNISEFLNQFIQNTKHKKMGHLKLAPWNHQSFDLGIPHPDSLNASQINSHIQELESQMDFVMILELMNESLVLLADKLGMELRHVVMAPIRKRKDSMRVTLSQIEKDFLTNIQTADNLLYNHFKDKLLKEISDFGEERMKASVEELNHLSQNLQESCRTQRFLKFGDNLNLKERSNVMFDCRKFGYVSYRFYPMLMEKMMTEWNRTQGS